MVVVNVIAVSGLASTLSNGESRNMPMGPSLEIAAVFGFIPDDE